MNARTAARLQLVAAAVLFSTGGAAIKAADLTGWQIASFRSGFAAVAILLIAPAARRGWSWRTLLVGLTYAATLTLFVLANKLTTSANTIFLQSTAPMYLLLLGPWLLKEPVRRQDLGVLAAVAVGLTLFFVGVERPVATAPDPVRGNLLALASGLFWALTVAGLRWLGSRSDAAGSAIGAVAAGNLIAFGLGLPFALPIGGGPVDWAVVLYLGVFQIAVAYFLVTAALRSLPALESSLILLVEPALNPIWAWLLHAEAPGGWAVAGGAIILGATVVRSWLESRTAAPSVVVPVD